MPEFVGVTHAALHLPTKRDLLLFDRIACVNLQAILAEAEITQARELHWLIDEGLVTEPRESIRTPEVDLSEAAARDFERFLVHVLSSTLLKTATKYEHAIERIATREFARERLRNIELLAADRLDAIVDVVSAELFPRLLRPASTGDVKHLIEKHRYAQRQLSVRFHANRLKQLERYDAAAILPSAPLEPLVPSRNSSARAVEVVLKSLPIPDASTPWEQIMEFRSDANAVRSLRRLRRWLSAAVQQERPTLELAYELEALLDAYEEHMTLHKMKTQRSTLQTVLVTGMEIVQNLATLQFARATEAIFAIKGCDLALLEAEQAAPGRDVAYISQARQHFSSARDA